MNQTYETRSENLPRPDLASASVPSRQAALASDRHPGGITTYLLPGLLGNEPTTEQPTYQNTTADSRLLRCAGKNPRQRGFPAAAIHWQDAAAEEVIRCCVRLLRVHENVIGRAAGNLCESAPADAPPRPEGDGL